MSSSIAPSNTACLASASLTAGRWAPDGNPITEHGFQASRTPSSTTWTRRVGETHTAATPNSLASAHRRTTSAADASGFSSV